MGFRFAFLTLLGVASLSFAEETKEEDCGKGWHPYRVTTRHIEANGIGYNQGYTTVEGFFAGMYDCWTPFLDVRAHVFNNGKPAATGGLGLRGDFGWIFGANVYYDFRKTSEGHYNQIAGGLEALGSIWELRANGYLPVGDKASGYFDTKFKRFQRNRIILHRKKEIAMAGIDGEVGAHFCKMCDIDLFAGIGPYYFGGNGSRSTTGGKFRLTGRWKEYITAEGTISYDRVFRDIYQGQLGVTIPFGGRHSIAKTASRSCSNVVAFNHRRLQPVVRDEIIVIERKKHNTWAINPITGEPYRIWFVNNTSHSAGTFESPFSTLQAAQNASSPADLIYVYPGDGTANGMSDGIALKDNQQLLGAAVPHKINTTAGVVRMPVSALVMPQLTNTGPDLAGDVIQIGNGNTISGFNITSTNQSCIAQGNSAIPLHGLKVQHCVLQQNTLAGISAILALELGGKVTIRRNTITGDQGIDIEQSTFGSNANYILKGNRITTTTSPIALSHAPTSGIATYATFNISNNVVTVMGVSNAVTITSGAAASPRIQDTATIVGNQINGTVGFFQTGMNLNAHGNATLFTETVSSNQITNCDQGMTVIAMEVATLNSTVTNNTVIGSGANGGQAFTFHSTTNATNCVAFDGNTGGQQTDGLLFITSGTSRLSSYKGNSLLTISITGANGLKSVSSCN